MIDMEKFLKLKGQFVRASWSSQKDGSAKHKDKKLVKKTSGVFHAGCRFPKIAPVRDAIRDGERDEPGPLPWGKWKIYPMVIEHNEQEYVRLYPPNRTTYQVDGNEVSEMEYNQADENRRRIKSISDWGRIKLIETYYVDDVEVSREEFYKFLTPSQIQKDQAEPDCFVVKTTNLISLAD